MVATAPPTAYDHIRLTTAGVVGLIAIILSQGMALMTEPLLVDNVLSFGLVGASFRNIVFAFVSLWIILRLPDWLYKHSTEEPRPVCPRIPPGALLVVVLISFFWDFGSLMLFMILGFAVGWESLSLKSLYLMYFQGEWSVLLNSVVAVGEIMLAVYCYKQFHRIAVRLATIPLYFAYLLFAMILIPVLSNLGVSVGTVTVSMVLPVLVAPILMATILGLRYAPAYIYLDVSVEPAPPGSHIIHQSPFQSDLKSRVRSMLNHSIPYEAPEIIDRIIAWIRNVDQARHGITQRLEEGP